MRTSKVAVSPGHCPRCAQHTHLIAEFVNDRCIDPMAHVEYQSCKKCKKVWRWRYSPHGDVVITDMRALIKQVQDDLDYAS